jgi:hypothetical protein
VAGTGGYRVLEQLRLVRHPGKVLIDKRAKIGRFTEYAPDRKDVEYRFNFHSAEIDQPVPDGLFFLTLELDGGKSWDGWFILSHLTSTRSPKIVSPQLNQVITTGRPRFFWVDFQSDRYAPFEERALLLRLSPKDQQLTRWSLRRELPQAALSSDPLHVEVGRDGLLSGARELDNGQYWLSVAYDEIRHFGKLIVASQSMSIVPFVIRKP